MSKQIPKRLNNANQGIFELNPLEVQLVAALKGLCREILKSGCDGHLSTKVWDEAQDAIAFAESV